MATNYGTSLTMYLTLWYIKTCQFTLDNNSYKILADMDIFCTVITVDKFSMYSQ